MSQMTKFVGVELSTLLLILRKVWSEVGILMSSILRLLISQPLLFQYSRAATGRYGIVDAYVKLVSCCHESCDRSNHALTHNALALISKIIQYSRLSRQQADLDLFPTR